ncbi:tRNA (adenosine(37)-N6)-threonylcarbamoyltransferase complex dimerization subunit type 1 TsaB [Acidicapsa dinghuensis]|uniref:tRNA (Adenosine(37)-N6)-threonylcarbamoyltransferase complex dimerization subunit type 1 TsaB n=1 Tax=Acidicapsa dinghuensis TaxID=2218256 RepID=A0ABW1EFB6_9BACT|nr:tRNA (adenosine(37)-N6)-threonylcarbamoyltransferase complex dimerization subunit type 1 TsaB [Acidicapsa dinghuensis]
MTERKWLLGIDTCGSVGYVALSCVEENTVSLLQEIELASGEFSAAIVSTTAELLLAANIKVHDLAGIVAVYGPGSFTGIRVGLATVKAMAEAAEIPVVTVSRLAVLAHVAGVPCAVLDAYRGQVFLGVFEDNAQAREMLVTAGEFSNLGKLPGPVAFCEESVAHLLETVATDVNLKRSRAPRASDAIGMALNQWRAHQFADVAALDGHYLRGAEVKMSTRAGRA